MGRGAFTVLCDVGQKGEETEREKPRDTGVKEKSHRPGNTGSTKSTVWGLLCFFLPAALCPRPKVPLRAKLPCLGSVSPHLTSRPSPMEASPPSCRPCLDYYLPSKSSRINHPQGSLSFAQKSSNVCLQPEIFQEAHLSFWTTTESHMVGCTIFPIFK